MSPGWITFCTSWTSYLSRDLEYYYGLCALRVVATVNFSPSRVTWIMREEQFPMVSDTKQQKEQLSIIPATPTPINLLWFLKVETDNLFEAFFLPHKSVQCYINFFLSTALVASHKLKHIFSLSFNPIYFLISISFI